MCTEGGFKQDLVFITVAQEIKDRETAKAMVSFLVEPDIAAMHGPRTKFHEIRRLYTMEVCPPHMSNEKQEQTDQ